MQQAAQVNTCFIYYRKYILQITQPSQYRCTQLQYRFFAVISEAHKEIRRYRISWHTVYYHLLSKKSIIYFYIEYHENWTRLLEHSKSSTKTKSDASITEFNIDLKSIDLIFNYSHYAKIIEEEERKSETFKHLRLDPLNSHEKKTLIKRIRNTFFLSNLD